MARLITLAVLVTLFLGILIFLFIDDILLAFKVMFLLILGFSLFIYAIYRGALRIQKELLVINKYLENVEKVDKIAKDDISLFTYEFEEINQNLIKILKSGKKREAVKQRYNAKLKLKNRQRGDMISAIAHEFRNPIASIMGYAQTLEEDKEIPAPLREKFLGKIYNNGLKIESLLGRLILWNKFESGEATLHPSTFELWVLCEEVKATLEEKYSQREIQIEGIRREIVADRTLIEIVLKNLIENGLKYSTDTVRVLIESNHIFVIDKGLGISPHDIEKVTKKFYRSGTHNWDNSMGLGLSIVKSILTLHHTKLEIESQEEKGSIFTFKI